MSYSSDLVSKIRRMHFYEHYTIYAISKVVGLHRDTIKRILYQDEAPKSASNRVSIIDPYAAIIREHLDLYPGIRGTKLLQILRDRGYKGSINTLNRYIRPLRKKSKRSYRPMTYLAGEQAQVDWGHFGSLDVEGGKRKLYLFAMVLSYSRAIYAEFTFDTHTDSFLRLHERAFEYFGGNPRKLLYDNLKSAVIERLGDDVRFNPQLNDFAGFYGFEPAACRPYSGNEKGRVERAIRYVRDSFASGAMKSNLEGLNQDLDQWLRGVANIRPWPGGREKSVSEVWSEERELLVRPDCERKFHATRSVTAKSSKTGLVRFDLNDYSIPSDYQNQLITVEADDHRVCFFHEAREIASHQRSWGRGCKVFSPDHWRQKPSNNKRQYREQILNIFPELMESLKVLMQRGETKITMIKRFYQLYELYGEESLREAIIASQKIEKYHPEQVCNLLIKRSKDSQHQKQPIIIKDQNFAKLNVRSHSLDLYDLF